MGNYSCSVGAPECAIPYQPRLRASRSGFARRNHIFRKFAGQFRQMVELHLICADALSERAQFDDQIMKFRLRNLGFDTVPAAPACTRIKSKYPATAR